MCIWCCPLILRTFVSTFCCTCSSMMPALLWWCGVCMCCSALHACIDCFTSSLNPSLHPSVSHAAGFPMPQGNSLYVKASTNAVDFRFDNGFTNPYLEYTSMAVSAYSYALVSVRCTTSNVKCSLGRVAIVWPSSGALADLKL